MSIRLSLLDGGTLGLQEVFETATQAEALGYQRFWLAEHFEAGSHASALMMSALVAGVTEHIRVGPAGVLLAFGTPLEVANSSLLLSAMFAGRFDLGVAAGSTSAQLLQELTGGTTEFAAPGYFENKVRRLAALQSLVDGLPVGRHGRPRFRRLFEGFIDVIPREHEIVLFCPFFEAFEVVGCAQDHVHDSRYFLEQRLSMSQ